MKQEDFDIPILLTGEERGSKWQGKIILMIINKMQSLGQYLCQLTSESKFIY